MRIFLLFSAALIAAVSTTYAVVERLSDTSTNDQATSQSFEPEIAMVDVLVAGQSLGAGTLLGPDDLRWQPWPEANLGDSFVTRRSIDDPDPRDDFMGSVVRRPISEATPISPSNLLQPGDRGFLAAVLSPGKRAISIAVDETTGLAGLVFPGDHVDLVMTHRAAEAAGFGAWPGSRQASETVLSDIRILALDQRLESVDGVAQQARTATLEVSPQEAETIALARNMGDLTLTLNSARPDPGTDDGAKPQYVSTLAAASMPSMPPLPDFSEAGGIVPAGLSTLFNGTNGSRGTDEEQAPDTDTLYSPIDDPADAPSFTLDTEISRVLGNLMTQEAETQDEESAESDTDETSPPQTGEADAEPEGEDDEEKDIQNLQVVRGSSSEMLTFGDDRPAESDRDSTSGGSTTSAASLGQSAAGMAGGL